MSYRTPFALTLVLALAAAVVPAVADETVESLLPPLPEGSRWELTFADEFEGDRLDETRWQPRDYGEFIRNNELQAYVEDAFEVRDGVLRIVARRQPARYAGRTQEYTSGMMITKGMFSQQYGYFEIRCRVPKGQGLWPAFWTLEDRDPQPWPPEIDILEFLGHEPHTMHFNVHWRTPQGRRHDPGSFTGPDFTADFHIIGCLWTADEMVWYVDGEPRYRYTGEGIPHVPMYLMVNLAVGGNWPGSPDETTPFPSAYEIDFVRVYQRVDP